MSSIASPTKNDAHATASPAVDRVRRVELLISVLLRTGVITSLSVVILGMIISFARHNDYFRSPDSFTQLTRSDATFPHTIPAVLSGVRQLRGQALVMLGLLLLIATPVMRVAVSIVAFMYERDLTYVIITSMVLLLLLLSFVLGRGEG